MRRLAVLAVALLCLLGATSARAAQGVDRQAWARVGPVPTFTGADDRIYVAINLGQEEARAFVQLDLSGLDRTHQDGATLVVREATESLQSSSATIAVCALSVPFVGEGMLTSEIPEVDCSVRVDPLRDEDGSWRIDLAVFVERWAATGSNYGLAFLAVADATPPPTFRLAFDTLRSELVLDPRSESPPGPPPFPSTVPPPFTADREPVATSSPLLAFPPVPTVAEIISPGPPTKPPALNPTAEVTPGRQLTSGRVVASASSPSPSLLVVFILVVALAASLVPRIRRRIVIPQRLEGRGGIGIGGLVLIAAALPLLASELTIYRAGLVLCFFVAACGLHLLVNWAGELSLAHAAVVGLPAFVVLTISDNQNLSPLYLLPVGAVSGGLLGAAIGLPTLRAKGLQVVIITLIVGVAVDRYAFRLSWLVGSASGHTAAVPRLGPVEFSTSRSLYPVLLGITASVVVAVWLILHSKVARAWFWVRADPAAAAALGIPVTTYRLLAYAGGGALGGLGGALIATWVQRVGPQAFPTSLSVTYLIVTILAGAGFIGGLAVATLVIEGGRQFSSSYSAASAYVGAIGLILVITRYEAGFNGIGRRLMTRLRISEVAGTEEEASTPEPITLSFVGGWICVALGFLSIGLAWYHTGNTDQTWVQNQEIVSGGLGGLSLVLLGVGLLVRDRLGRNHITLLRELRTLRGEDRPAPGGSSMPEKEPTTRPMPAARGSREPAMSSASTEKKASTRPVHVTKRAARKHTV